MALQVYKDMMEHLSQTLSYKLGRDVLFSSKVLKMPSNMKWVAYKNVTIFPLHLDLIPLGHLKVNQKMESGKVKEVFNIIQWALFSLEEIFNEHRIKIYINHDLDPLLIYDLPDKNVLDVAHDIYDKSSAQFLIRCQGSPIDRSVFSSDLPRAMVFISNVFALSEEDQVFLSQYFKNRTKGPIIVGSIHPDSQSKVLKSLLDCFLHLNLEAEEELENLELNEVLKFSS